MKLEMEWISDPYIRKLELNSQVVENMKQQRRRCITLIYIRKRKITKIEPINQSECEMVEGSSESESGEEATELMEWEAEDEVQNLVATQHLRIASYVLTYICRNVGYSYHHMAVQHHLSSGFWGIWEFLILFCFVWSKEFIRFAVYALTFTTNRVKPKQCVLLFNYSNFDFGKKKFVNNRKRNILKQNDKRRSVWLYDLKPVRGNFKILINSGTFFKKARDILGFLATWSQANLIHALPFVSIYHKSLTYNSIIKNLVCSWRNQDLKMG